MDEQDQKAAVDELLDYMERIAVAIERIADKLDAISDD
jgi:hypothetical protein